MASNVRLRNCALVLALIGGTALMPQIASAGSIQGRGDFGGSWTRIGPSDHERWRHRYYYSAPIYVAPSYAYAYGPTYYDYYGPTYYDYGPAVALGGPGLGVAIE